MLGWHPTPLVRGTDQAGRAFPLSQGPGFLGEPATLVEHPHSAGALPCRAAWPP